jgi:glucosylceramidase
VVSTAVKNPDGSIAVAIFNPTETSYSVEIKLNNKKTTITIPAKALQTLIIK